MVNKTIHYIAFTEIECCLKNIRAIRRMNAVCLGSYSKTWLSLLVLQEIIATKINHQFFAIVFQAFLWKMRTSKVEA